MLIKFPGCISTETCKGCLKNMKSALNIYCLILAALLQPLVAQNFVVSSDNLKSNLQNFSRPRSSAHAGERMTVQNFLTSFFRQLEKRGGTELVIQIFNTDRSVDGKNIIFLVKGSLYKKGGDKITIIGAHYDSYNNSPGVNDDGSGMAAMLEIARLLCQVTTVAQRKYTTVFVAFDFSNLDQIGSKTFVTEVLTKNMLRGNALLHGAVILDNIMNYNTTANSQKLYQGFELLFRDTFTRIKENEYRGDFQVVVGKMDEKQILKDLARHWNFVTNTSSISKLETIQLPVPGSIDPKSLFGTLLKRVPGDYIPFWTSTRYFKAVIITDTMNYRGYMKKCYQKSCDDLEHVTPDMYRLLTCTTQTVFNYVFKTVTGLTPQGHCGTTAAAAVKISVSSTLLVFGGIICSMPLWD